MTLIDFIQQWHKRPVESRKAIINELASMQAEWRKDNLPESESVEDADTLNVVVDLLNHIENKL